LIEAGEKEATIIAERIRTIIETQVLHTENGVINFTVSIGISTLSKCNSLDDLSNNSDKAFQRAIDAGRNRISC
jgi:PleD family two-component response regulator